MRAVRKGDPIKAIRDAVDNSFMGRLLGLSGSGLVSRQDKIPQYDPNRNIYDVDPAGLPSTIDAVAENFTPVGDIYAIADALSAAGGGRYAEAALLPLMMLLPQAMSGKLRKSVDDLRKVKMSRIPEA